MGVTAHIYDANPGFEEFVNSNYIYEDLPRYRHRLTNDGGVLKFVFWKRQETVLEQYRPTSTDSTGNDRIYMDEDLQLSQEASTDDNAIRAQLP